MNVSFMGTPKISQLKPYVKPRTTGNIKVAFEKDLMSGSGVRPSTNPNDGPHDSGSTWTGSGGGWENW